MAELENWIMAMKFKRNWFVKCFSLFFSSVWLSKNFISSPSKKPWHKTIQVINCTIFFRKQQWKQKLCLLNAYKICMEPLIHVTGRGNWPVQGFAWYEKVKIIIAREKFIVYKSVLRMHEHTEQIQYAYGPRVLPHFRHATHFDLHSTKTLFR